MNQECNQINDCFIYKVSYILIGTDRMMIAAVENVNIIGVSVNDIVKQLEKEYVLKEHNQNTNGQYIHSVIEEVIITECFEIGAVFGCTDTVVGIMHADSTDKTDPKPE